MYLYMDKFDISLSRRELQLISTCLSSCSANCFYSGNASLATEYLKLRYKFIILA